MKKTKKGNSIKFDPSRYKHLDRANLQTWIREFLSRNQEFMADYKKFTAKPSALLTGEPVNVSSPIYKKYKVLPPYVTPDNRDQLQNDAKPNIYIRRNVRSMRLFEHYNAYRTFKEQNDLDNVTDPEVFDTTIGTIPVPSSKSAVTILGGLLDEPPEDTTYPCGDTLLLSVNLTSSRKNIEEGIKKILDIHKERKEGNFRPDKWKFYLIVFDLKKAYENVTWDEIAGTLYDAFPDHGHILDAKNVENYYKGALALINGEYKKYL